MNPAAGETFGIVGPLEAFPFRLASKAARHVDAACRRGVSRATTLVVIGRRLAWRGDEAAIERRVDSARSSGRPVVSETGFLRRIGLAADAGTASLARTALIEQSGLSGRKLDLLTLFDAFEGTEDGYSFRDLILARKYAGLLSSGASWSGIARSVHRAPGPVSSLTPLTLRIVRGDRILAGPDHAASELDGQMLLPIDGEAEADIETLFSLAEEAEADGRMAEAAEAYGRCLAVDPGDSTAAFNRANCLAAAGRAGEAQEAYLLALKSDPGFVEAWFNLAGLSARAGDAAGARRHLATAIRLDPGYADAVYNLAASEFEAGDLAAARRWWSRYLELDADSDWATAARRGIRYVDVARSERGTG